MRYVGCCGQPLTQHLAMLRSLAIGDFDISDSPCLVHVARYTMFTWNAGGWRRSILHRRDAEPSRCIYLLWTCLHGQLLWVMVSAHVLPMLQEKA